MSEPVHGFSLRSAVQQLLTERGPMQPDTLIETLTERGFDLGPEPEEFLLDEVLEA